MISAFLTGWPSIIAVILNYVKRGEAHGSWLESHFRWQIRTFWFGLLWVVLCALFVGLTLGVGLLIVWLPLAIMTIWLIYRIVRGWLALSNRQSMYTLTRVDALRAAYSNPSSLANVRPSPSRRSHRLTLSTDKV